MAHEMSRYTLRSVEASEALLKDLYVDLRAKLRRWSAITFQTPQARMGYIGQHLTSVVTGYPGGRSGARGHDLKLPDKKFAEIKTCYRVDQLGKCLSCQSPVASIEAKCAACGSSNIQRNDDSKWLITIQNDDELRHLFDPECYYLVLFDFADEKLAGDIYARIFELDPRQKGFAYCQIDYYFNIKKKSKSGAPFNLWPFQLKFYVMKPKLIYHAEIGADDRITTKIFPGVVGHPNILSLKNLEEYSRSKNLTIEGLRHVARQFKIEIPASATRHQALKLLQNARAKNRWSEEELADAFADALYKAAIAPHRAWLPPNLR